MAHVISLRSVVGPIERALAVVVGFIMTPGLRVLVVDDEPLIRWSVAETLAERGYQVVERGDAEGARAALREGSTFDVVLLDYRLPDSDDLSLLASIRSRHPARR